MKYVLNFSNSFSYLRIFCSPFLLVPAFLGERDFFLWMFTILYITDFLDGFFARILGQMSELGTKLDSYGDLVMYIFGGIGMWILWPEILERESLAAITIVVSYVVADLAGLLRWKRLTSYHTLGDKFSMVIVGGSAILLFGFDMRWPFHLSALIMALAALEEIAITMILPTWKANVPTVVHAIRERMRYER